MVAETEQWSVTGYVITPNHAKTAPVHLARRAEDGAFALVQEIGNSWHRKGPIVDLETAMRTAEHVAAGDPRALTWPDMPLTLACALLAFDYVAHSAAIAIEAKPADTPTEPA